MNEKILNQPNDPDRAAEEASKIWWENNTVPDPNRFRVGKAFDSAPEPLKIKTPEAVAIDPNVKLENPPKKLN